jgi:hypothetical protein
MADGSGRKAARMAQDRLNMVFRSRIAGRIPLRFCAKLGAFSAIGASSREKGNKHSAFHKKFSSAEIA